MPEEQRWKRMGDVRSKILEAQVLELASLLSECMIQDFWLQPRAPSKKMCDSPQWVSETAEKQGYQRRGLHFQSLLRPPKTAGERERERNKQGLNGSARKAQLAEQERQWHDLLSKILLQSWVTLSTQMSLTVLTEGWGRSETWQRERKDVLGWEMAQYLKRSKMPSEDDLVSQEKRGFFLCTPPWPHPLFFPGTYLAWT